MTQTHKLIGETKIKGKKCWFWEKKLGEKKFGEKEILGIFFLGGQ